MPTPAQFKLRLDPELKKRLEDEAQSEGFSINAVINGRLWGSYESKESALAAAELIKLFRSSHKRMERALRLTALLMAEVTHHVKKPDAKTAKHLETIQGFARALVDGDDQEMVTAHDAMIKYALKLGLIEAHKSPGPDELSQITQKIEAVKKDKASLEKLRDELTHAVREPADLTDQ